jgi:hypothetical protein
VRGERYFLETKREKEREEKLISEVSKEMGDINTKRRGLF